MFFCFEPHPHTRKILEENVALWFANSEELANINILPIAVSSYNGHAVLRHPESFVTNSGLSTLEENENNASEKHEAFQVEPISFDDWSKSIEKFSLVKVDVEGHEDKVFLGVKASLLRNKIDCIIFEEHRPLPSIATKMLEEYGYRCFLIYRTFWGPVLGDVRVCPKSLVGEATNILAVSSDVYPKELGTSGWTCLN